VTEEQAQPLLESDVDPDPLVQFASWFEAAREAKIRAPEAAALATATAAGAPSARIVLVKSFGEGGFVFYTGTESRKGRELAENPRAALLFHWDTLGRQVRIEGTVRPLPAADADTYFRTRPRGNQLSAWASPQSQVVPSRAWLEKQVAERAEEFRSREIGLPPAWGGYRLAHESVEFWQHREDRLHDRLRYRRDGERWSIERLGP
jgi:pyridoxamine 5'-phosphate oxidase